MISGLQIYICPHCKQAQKWGEHNTCGGIAPVAPLTAAPAPVAQPLMDEQIFAASARVDVAAAFTHGFYQGARFAERAHGIKATGQEGGAA